MVSDDDSGFPQCPATTPGEVVVRMGELDPIRSHMRVPNEKAEPDYSQPPDWVVELLRTNHRCNPFPDKRRHHVNVWELTVRRLPVTYQAKAVAAVLAEHWPRICPGLRRIAALCGLSKGSVDNGIAVLRFAGLVETEPHPGRSTRYYLTYPRYPIEEAHVKAFTALRRTPKSARPAHVVGASSSDEGDLMQQAAHVLGRVPPTTWAAPTHDGDAPQPPRGPEVVNEAQKNAVNEGIGLRSSAARARLDRRLAAVQNRHGRDRDDDP